MPYLKIVSTFVDMNLKKLNRKQLASIVKANNKIINNCKKQNLEVLRASYLLTDKRQQYKEETVTLGRGRTRRTELQGRVYWMQTFVDEGTGEEFKIERSMIVRINNEWI